MTAEKLRELALYLRTLDGDRGLYRHTKETFKAILDADERDELVKLLERKANASSRRKS